MGCLWDLIVFLMLIGNAHKLEQTYRYFVKNLQTLDKRGVQQRYLYVTVSKVASAHSRVKVIVVLSRQVEIFSG